MALAMVHAITGPGHTHTSKSTDYCPNCTQKCVNNIIILIATLMYSSPAYHIPQSRGKEGSSLVTMHLAN